METFSYTPVPTLYNGFRFRSRREARWAVFFDNAGIRYFYEPEGFRFEDGLQYLPDFYLPDVYSRGGRGIWAEVKGILSPTDNKKMENLIRLPQINNVALLFEPDADSCDNELMWLDSDGTICWDNVQNFKRCPVCGAITYEYDTIKNRCHNPSCRPGMTYSISFDQEYTAARQARFEFGQTPKGI